MRINADFSKPAWVVPAADDWVLSPESGVERLMLHAAKLKFSHPELGDYDLRCEPPAEFNAIVERYA